MHFSLRCRITRSTAEVRSSSAYVGSPGLTERRFSLCSTWSMSMVLGTSSSAYSGLMECSGGTGRYFQDFVIDCVSIRPHQELHLWALKGQKQKQDLLTEYLRSSGGLSVPTLCRVAQTQRSLPVTSEGFFAPTAFCAIRERRR